MGSSLPKLEADVDLDLNGNVGVGLGADINVTGDSAKPLSALILGDASKPVTAMILGDATKPVALSMNITGDAIKPISAHITGDSNKPVALSFELMNLPRFTVHDVKDMMKQRLHLPHYTQVCFKILGTELFSFCLSGEAQAITEPYVPNSHERCEVTCCDADTSPFPEQKNDKSTDKFFTSV